MKAILFLSAPFRKYYAWANENHGRAACFFFLSVGLIGLGLLAELLHTPFIEVIRFVSLLDLHAGLDIMMLLTTGPL